MITVASIQSPTRFSDTLSDALADGAYSFGTHTNDVFTYFQNRTLPIYMNTCSLGKAGVLYGFNFTSGRVLEYYDRVVADSGTVVDQVFARETYDVIMEYNASLIAPMTAGKAGVLYTMPSTVNLDVSAKADASANDASDLVYSFDAVPSVVFTYAVSGANLNVTVTDLTTNPYGSFRLYEATDHRAQFSNVADVTLPHTRSVTLGELNFKHKVNYVANGTKDGSPYVVESQSSRPAYYINAKNKI